MQMIERRRGGRQKYLLAVKSQVRQVSNWLDVLPNRRIEMKLSASFKKKISAVFGLLSLTAISVMILKDNFTPSNGLEIYDSKFTFQYSVVVCSVFHC